MARQLCPIFEVTGQLPEPTPRRLGLERTDVTVSLLPAALGEGRYGAVLLGAF